MKPYYETELGVLYQGDALEVLQALKESGVKVQTCVTSPPYWGLRDYGVKGQLGLERTPAEYVERMNEIFGSVNDLLNDDGTLWLNLGDSYAGSRKGGEIDRPERKMVHLMGGIIPEGLKSKDLVGIPWRVAFSLQALGWYLRSDIIWSKPNPMPESVRDRPTKAHEYIFLMSKSEKYFYDYKAIKEATAWDVQSPKTPDGWDTGKGSHGSFHKEGREKGKTDKQRGHSRRHEGFNDRWDAMTKEEQASYGRNKRTVWTVPTRPYKEAHFATFPPDLIKPCVLAGARAGDIVLDPFMGAGTTALVCEQLGRRWIGIELSKEYCDIAVKRIEEERSQLKLL